MPCLKHLKKAEDPQAYKESAQKGMMLAYPVSINGETHRKDNGIGYHTSIKVFEPDRDHPHTIHNLAQHLPLGAPDAKNTQIEPGIFKDKKGNDIYVIKLHGRSADKLKENNAKFSHMGTKQPYEYEAHISVPKDFHDKIKTNKIATAHEAGIKFGHAELKRGPKTLQTYRKEPDSAEPKVPDESDFTAKVNVNKSEISLEKGEKGDYKKEGYRIKSLPHKEFTQKFPKYSDSNSLMPHHIASPADQVHYAVSPQNKIVGHVAVKSHPNHLYPVDSQVNPEHQRKGLATALYSNAEKHHGKKLKHSDNPADHSPDAQKLWAQPNRPFGKTEENLEPLMKPYTSLAQERWAHTESGLKALGGKAGVHEWDEATKGKKLPERVGKSEEEIKSIIKKKHSLHSKFSKAFSLTGDTLKKYIDDNADLKKALEE